ncbi:aminotransferase class I/II-fold pyridoxal phosphate-dependent enzyme [Dysgonomonas sp. Marseille-P4677]|uniref:aminotransferase class I/II-fold pyridoxal phosphate-dependent enzyme n=1 Tax=Dysgonomonas sp. Marseille-P4677 TaxID=2364790 RepID=UPI00191363DA|nr:aminotransferase class I/II-fold pyridoxal phosphate-dependent enzyme [Dysgonomonas sp. Marseille-P4677]MBK5720173.1 aminotransferase class I/II-fold pyridoxal phosphate-dependent enzyme [Dysgonomonas sp. Marseille-P4677]
MILGHGDDIYSHNKPIVSNFSSNIYSRQNLSDLQQYLCSHIDAIHSYPEPDASSLLKLLAQKHSVGTENISVTNGATEAIYLIAQAFQNSVSSIISPTFSEYGDASCVNNHKVQYVRCLQEVDPYANLVWICNPNNPTGTVTSKDLLKEYIVSHPLQYIVIDQSYEHFTTKDLFSVEEASGYKNVLLLHSMTKHYAIPGLRLGYITAHTETLRMISKYRMPWSVNGLAIEAGRFLLEKEDATIDLNNYLIETKRLQNELNRIDGIIVLPSDTHFFLCKLENKKASDLKKYLIDDYGILIRDAANFNGLNEHYFRIATQSKEENNLLVKGIKGWI